MSDYKYLLTYPQDFQFFYSKHYYQNVKTKVLQCYIKESQGIKEK